MDFEGITTFTHFLSIRPGFEVILKVDYCFYVDFLWILKA